MKSRLISFGGIFPGINIDIISVCNGIEPRIWKDKVEAGEIVTMKFGSMQWVGSVDWIVSVFVERFKR